MTKNEVGTGNRPRCLIGHLKERNEVSLVYFLNRCERKDWPGNAIGATHRTLGSEYSDWHRIANCRLRGLPWENQVRVLFSRIFSRAEGLRILSIIRLLVVVHLCRFW